ncbi:hypothetical protein V8E54_013536 [Elaphomyces granulatus]
MKSHFDQVVDLGEHDNSEIKRAVLPHTESKYERALRIYDQFIKLHPQAVDPPDIKSYKAFMEFYSKNTPDRLDDRPTVGTAEDFRGDFEAGMSRCRNYRFPDQVSTTIREWIPSALKDKIGLSTAEMHKDGLSPNDLTVLMTQLWCKDFKEYRGEPPDRTRVQLSAAIILYCFTSARTGEVHESTARRALARKDKNKTDNKLEARVLAACYKHYHLTIESLEGRALLVLTYQREFIKGYWRKQRWELPIHAFYDIYRESMPLFLNLLTFFLPMALSDGCPSPACPNCNIADMPAAMAKLNECFAKCIRTSSLSRALFYIELIKLSENRSLQHTLFDIMKLAGHENPRTFGKSYAHPLWQSLPAKAEFEFQERSDILALDETMENLSLKLSKASSAQEKDQIRLDRHRAYNEKKRLYLEELKRLRKLQPNKPKSATSVPNGLHEESLFYYRRRVMPERDYLATVLSQRIELRSSEGRRAVEALESLCSIPTADGYIFTAVMGYVLGMNMALQNTAFNVIVGLMIVQSGNGTQGKAPQSAWNNMSQTEVTKCARTKFFATASSAFATLLRNPT